MTPPRRLAAVLAAGAVPVAFLASVQPTSAAPSPSSLTVGVNGAAAGSQSFSGGPITGSEDASGNLTPPVSCDAPACESIPLTVKAPPGLPAKSITVTVTVNFNAAATNPLGLTGLDTYLLDSQGNQVAGDSLGSAPSVAAAGQLDPGSYTIEITGEAGAAQETYTGTVTASLSSVSTVPSVTQLTTPLRFAPSTVVSPVILGGEPQISQERPDAVTAPGAGLDTQRGFVDWPVSSRTQIGTLWRTVNGGDSYRQLVDLTCAERQVPNCFTGGGGDTVNRVNNYNGDVLFGDQESLVQEAFASSADHGDSFPLTRQTAISSTATGVDRQWISAVDAPGFMGGPFVPFELDGLFSYHIPEAGEYVAGVGTDGILRPGVAPVIPSVTQSGPSRVDVQPGSHGKGWFYQSYRDGNGFEVASVPLSSYQDPTAYSIGNVNSDTPQVFPWITLDRQGNLYAVWIGTDGQLYYSFSKITDPANDPTATPPGVPATKWSPKLKVNPPALGSTIFPEVVAGDAGRIAITYMATGDYTGVSDNAPAGSNPARWTTYVSESVDALSATPHFQIGEVSHRWDHLGSICTAGTTCLVSMGDRSLLDMIDVTMDDSGRLAIVYCDNNTSFARQEISTGSQGGGFVKVARLANGPSLLQSHSPFAIGYSNSFRNSAAGDATWPNTAAGTNLPGLDLTGVGASFDGSNLVGRIDLADASATGMAAAISGYNSASSAVNSTDPSASRVQYVLRWDSPEGETYYMTAEADTGGNLTFYGGKVDSSNAVNNVNAAVGIAYRPQTAFTVTGQRSGNTLLLKAPLSQFGLAPGRTLVSLEAFSLTGPADSALGGTATSQIFASMRDIDASPALDAVLAASTGPAGGNQPVTTNPTTGLSGTPNTSASRPGALAPLAAVWVLGVVAVARRSRRRRGA